MVHSMFAVYDSKAQAYLPPFIMPQISMAKRIFNDCVNAKDHQFAKHPADYTLFHLGHFDDENAEFSPLPNGRQSLGLGVEYVQTTETRPNGQDDTSLLTDS